MMRGFAVTVAIAATCVAGCGGGGGAHTTSGGSAATSAPFSATSTVGSSRTTAPTVAAFTEDQLKSASLAVTDLPTGWSSTTTAKQSSSACNKDSVDKAVPPAAKTTVDFVQGSNAPVFYEQLRSYTDAATAGRALDKYTSNASACTSYKSEGATINIGQLSVPQHGDRSIGYRLNISQSGSTFVADTDVMQRGPVLVYVALASYSADTEQMSTLTKLAYDKVVNTLHLG